MVSATTGLEDRLQVCCAVVLCCVGAEMCRAAAQWLLLLLLSYWHRYTNLHLHQAGNIHCIAQHPPHPRLQQLCRNQYSVCFKILIRVLKFEAHY